VSTLGYDRSTNQQPMNTESRLPPISAWRPQYLRLIAFPTEPPVVKYADQRWLKELTGVQDDDITSVKQKHFRQDQSKYNGTLLSVAADLQRVAWTCSPIVEEIPEGLPTLPALPENIDWFRDLMGRWLTSACPPITRLAFASELIQDAADHDSAYRQLGAYLPAVRLETTSSDFRYQINRKRPSSTVKNVLINRLIGWGAIQTIVSIDSPLQRSKTQLAQPGLYCALSLDMNTLGDSTDPMPAASLNALFGELVALGLEIAERGDVPDA
jgi:hypothetical protein